MNKSNIEVINWKTELLKVHQCPQAQDGLNDQLARLWIIANKFGLYDAADYLREHGRRLDKQ